MTDPAYKYVPKEKGASATNGNSSQDGNHGTFTDIAYVTAWAIAILGTATGIFMILAGFNTYAGQALIFSGIGAIVSSWVTASLVGVLAEISRKLTKAS